jgi:hypothetical protein
MNLYLVARDEGVNYDEYDSFVCAAPSAEAARQMNPGGDTEYSRTWIDLRSEQQRNKLKITLLGEAKDGTVADVILGSFNAG